MEEERRKQVQRLKLAMSRTKSIAIGEFAIVVNIMKFSVFFFFGGCEVAGSKWMGIFISGFPVVAFVME